MKNLDRLTYNTNDINGPPLDLDTNSPLMLLQGPVKAVNRNAPDTGANRSIFQRFIELIAAANGVKTCNKQSAILKTGLDVCGFTLPQSVADFLIGILT